MKTESKHTPGPWTWWNEPDRPRGYDLAKLLAPTGAILTMYGGPGIRALGATKEKQANAALIASAPDLLEELQRLVAICSIHMPPTDPKWTPTYLDSALAVIAKAKKGEQNGQATNE